MKQTIFLLLIINCAFLTCCQCQLAKDLEKLSSKHKILAESVDHVINEFLSKKYEITNIVTPDHSSFAVSDFKNEFLSRSFKSLKSLFRHDISSQLTVLRHRQRRVGILLIEALDDFKEILLNFSSKIFQYSGYYIIALVEGEIQEIEEIFKLLWKTRIYNVVVMYESKPGTVRMKTFFPFNFGICNDTTPVLINTFTQGKFIKSNDKIFPKKMNNLYNCSIRVAIANNAEPEIFIKILSNGKNDLSGRSIELMRTLSETLNFNINYSHIGPKGYVYENRTCEGPFKAVLDGDADLTISHWWLKENRLTLFEASRSYNSDPLHFVVPPGKDFTSFEKLVFPFNGSTWILVIVLNTTAFLVIFIVKMFPKTVQSFVFGTAVRYPYLNLFIGTVGGTQHILPRRNFARFLLMMFLLLSLVIRTIYNGSYYQFLKSNKHHKRVETVTEMVENDFTFYVYNGGEDLFTGMDAIKNRCVSKFVTKFN